MERRSFIYVFVGTGLLFVFLLMQGFTRARNEDQTAETTKVPATQTSDQTAGAGQATEAGQSVKAEQSAGADADSKSASPELEPGADEAESALEEDSTEGEGDAKDNVPNAEKAESEETDETSDEIAPKEAEEAEQQYLTIGDLAPGSPHQMLVTVNNAGAAVSKIELGARLRGGRLRYRDVDDHSGYIGHLWSIAEANGCRVQVVGAGTPAALAKSGDGRVGLKPGDIITSINDQPTGSPDELQQELAGTKPGEKISIAVMRDGKSITFDTVATDRPLEVIRPEAGIRADGTTGVQEAFLVDVKKHGKPFEVWPSLDPEMLEGTWDVARSDASSVTFERRLNSASVKDAAFDGELIIRKTFRVATVAGEQTEETLAESPGAYHLFEDIEIEKVSGEDDVVSLQINGPTGAPIEGWWYTNKIHGESTAFFSPAGARDVVISTDADSHSFFGGPEIFKKAISKDPDEPKTIAVFNNASSLAQRTIRYAGVDAQYFTLAMIPDQPDTPLVVSNMYLSPVYAVDKKKDSKRRKRVDVSFRMYSDPISLKAGDTYRQSFKIFAGPKESEALAAYGLDDVRTFGWFAWASKVLLIVLHSFYYILRNYGIAIILLTILVRLAMTPISRKAAINAQMMQVLQPEMKKLADKYKDDMEKRGQAQRELFKRHNYNPLSGCWLMFLQLPIFIGLYRGLNVDIALRDQPLIPGINWCSNLAGPDQLWYWKDWLPFEWLTGETGWLGPYLNILPLITVVLFLIQQKLFTPPPTDEQQAMTQKMMTFMMLFIGLMFFKVPAGLCIYFITSSLWGIAERKLLPKPVLDKEKFANLGKDDAEDSKKKKPGFMGIANPLGNNNGNIVDSADDRRRRDKERQKKLREKRS